MGGEKRSGIPDCGGTHRLLSVGSKGRMQPLRRCRGTVRVLQGAAHPRQTEHGPTADRSRPGETIAHPNMTRTFTLLVV